MNPIVQLAVNAALKYLESHPDQIDALVATLFDFLITEVRKAIAPA